MKKVYIILVSLLVVITVNSSKIIDILAEDKAIGLIKGKLGEYADYNDLERLANLSLTPYEINNIFPEYTSDIAFVEGYNKKYIFNEICFSDGSCAKRYPNIKYYSYIEKVDWESDGYFDSKRNEIGFDRRNFWHGTTTVRMVFLHEMFHAIGMTHCDMIKEGVFKAIQKRLELNDNFIEGENQKYKEECNL